MRVHNLYRSKRNRMIAGVAGGLAEYFGVDVILLRLLWLLSFFFGGAGLLIYIVAWIVMPSEQDEYGKQQRVDLRPQAGRTAAEAEAEVAVMAEAENENISASAPENSDGEAAKPEEAEAGKSCCASRWGSGDVSGKRRRRNAGMLLIGLGIIFLADQLFGPIFHFIWPLLLIILGVCLLLYERREVGS